MQKVTRFIHEYHIIHPVMNVFYLLRKKRVSTESQLFILSFTINAEAGRTK